MRRRGRGPRGRTAPDRGAGAGPADPPGDRRGGGRLFVARGYAAISLADIARDAAVARPTVFSAFGSKAALLREVVDQALAGDDEPVPLVAVSRNGFDCPGLVAAYGPEEPLSAWRRG